MASLRRWFSVDVFGMKIAALTDAFSEVADNAVEFRLKRAFPLLRAALAKPASYIPFILPASALAGASRGQISDTSGSGPFRYEAGERMVGSRVVYTKFAGYVPRPEPGDWLAGGKRALVDRVEWRIIPDASTASASLQKIYWVRSE